MNRTYENIQSEGVRVISGCRALHGCPVKERCLRYQQYLRSNPFNGFNADHSCIIPYQHFIESCRGLTK